MTRTVEYDYMKAKMSEVSTILIFSISSFQQCVTDITVLTLMTG